MLEESLMQQRIERHDDGRLWQGWEETRTFVQECQPVNITTVTVG